MDVFVARQPILDRSLGVVAYELLHRSSADNVFSGVDETTATAQVLADNALSDRVALLSEGKPMFVNFGQELLVGGQATLLEPGRLVVEILEDTEPGAEVLAVCTELKRLGYRLALDDCAAGAADNPLIGVIDIAKIDFGLTDPASRRALARQLRDRGVELLAEKVETRQEFDEAVALGCNLFQGYFFARPVVMAGRTLDATKQGQLALLGAVHDEDMDFAAVEAALRQDAALTDKLLRYINGAAFGWRSRITSLHHALVMLGTSQVRKWVSVVVLSEVAGGKPDALLTSSLLRAHMCEAVGGAAGAAVSGLQLFLLGLYSQLDALLDLPLDQALAGVALRADVKAALLGEPNHLRRVLDAVVAYERGEWDRLDDAVAGVSLAPRAVAECYLPAIEVVDRAPAV